METVAERWKHFPNWEEVRAKLKPGSKNGKSKTAKEQKNKTARITLRDWVRTLRIWAKLEIIWAKLEKLEQNLSGLSVSPEEVNQALWWTFKSL